MNVMDNVRDIRISDYNYDLPDTRIAKHPLEHREQCRLLLWQGGEISDHYFNEVPGLLPQDSMLVYNNTRVINARLRFQKETGSLIEIFCLEPVAPQDYALVFQATARCTWRCLVGNSKRWKSGQLELTFADASGRELRLTATRGSRHGNAWDITFEWEGADVTFASVLEAVGEIPIPPYLNRATEKSDSQDYQTVYSRIDGSVAAPTAGLHFTQNLLDECDKRGIVRRELTLHVGAGTFQPVKSDSIGEHDMHYEFIAVPRALIKELSTTARPVIAVGTTSVRTLESLYYIGRLVHDNPDVQPEELVVTQWMPYESSCELTAQEALTCIVDYLTRMKLNDLVASTPLMIAPGYTALAGGGIHRCRPLACHLRPCAGQRLPILKLWRRFFAAPLMVDNLAAFVAGLP